MNRHSGLKKDSKILPIDEEGLQEDGRSDHDALLSSTRKRQPESSCILGRFFLSLFGTKQSYERFVIGGLILLLFLVIYAMNSPIFIRRASSVDGLVTCRNGAVASENLICSKIGIQAFQDGGSAVDAAIATSICIGVTNMYSAGIGGGGFMLLRSASADQTHPPDDGKPHYEFIDFREEAPAAASTHMFDKDPMSARVGGLGFGVPGEIRGFEAAHKAHGILPWKRLFSPSVDLCRNGWPVPPRLHLRMSENMRLMLNDSAFREVFAPEGRLIAVGEIIKRPALGDSLEYIGEHGADAFYEGYIAEELVKSARERGGIITLDDFKHYKAILKEPDIGSYKSHKVVTTPLPSSGPVLISILNILEHFDFGDSISSLDAHRAIETFKHGFAQRSYYGDPIDPIFRNITDIQRKLTSKSFAARIFTKIFDNRTFPVPYYDSPFDVLSDHGTMHVSVLGRNGDAVSLTSTVNLAFGGQVMNRRTGIILNDEMDDFSIPGTSNAFGLVASPYNYVQPGKRPLSSSVPCMIETNGKIDIVIGASGGSRILTAVTQTLLQMLEYGQNPEQAVRAPRAHHQLLPDRIFAEHDFDEAILEDLRKFGHDIVVFPKGYTQTGVQAIRRLPDGTILAASDARKGGKASGW